jgi:transcriptional regulator with XRE-family HTH domain
MATRKSLGEKLAMLAKSTEKSQTEICGNLEMPASQLNRFFRGHSDLSSSNLNAVLKELGIDLEEIISKKIRKHADIDDGRIETAADCVHFLFNNLDELGKQTHLNTLAWAVKASTKTKLPEKVEEILHKELNLI